MKEKQGKKTDLPHEMKSESGISARNYIGFEGREEG